MANTYTKCYFQLVFAVYDKEALIKNEWRDELEKYISGIISHHGHKLLAIKAMPDHLHIFLGYNVNQKIPDLAENIKTSSNAWIKYQRKSKHKFDWQRGYGAFTYSRSHISLVCNYIANQEIHHKGRSFRDEYLEMLRLHEVDYKPEFLFEFF